MFRGYLLRSKALNDLSFGGDLASFGQRNKIGHRWKPLVIIELFSGTKRCGELKRAILAITEKMLIQTLKELESDGIINRKALPVVPPHVEYSLTNCGRDLEPVISEMFSGL
ncbi:winged helix-turn-helix transcriptional regulator [Dyadobacter bucti]|uniref:winged helix-turn-helix transcriptional regulator n=1 Tax=Dyadobacter bucti TaxID=2572203 RepID=UPI003F720540